MYVLLTYISKVNIRSILDLYLEVWWCFCDQKYAIGMLLLFISITLG